MVRHSVQERVDEWVRLARHHSLAPIFIEKAGKPRVRIVLDRGKLFYQASAKSNPRNCRRDSNSVFGEPFPDGVFVQTHVKTFVRLQQAKDRVAGSLADFYAVKQ